jgi:hypothetical protein
MHTERGGTVAMGRDKTARPNFFYGTRQFMGEGSRGRRTVWGIFFSQARQLENLHGASSYSNNNK